MFKENFKKANDSIHADEELVNKVLALKKHRVRPRVMSYIPAAAAAVVVISVSVTALPIMLNRNDDTGVISSTTVTEDSGMHDKAENAQKADASEHTDTLSGNAVQPTPAVYESAIKEKSSAKENSAVKSDMSTPVPYPPTLKPYAVPKTETPVYNATEIVEPEYDVPAYNETVQPADTYSVDLNIIDNDEGAVKQEEISVTEERVILSMNSGAYEPEMGMQVYGQRAAFSTESREWSYRDYFDYLGTVVSPVLPDDLKLIGHSAESVLSDDFLNERFFISVDDNGIPSFDNRIFAFSGDEGRYVSIQTSKDTSTAQVYLSDSNLSLSKVGESYAVLIGTTNDCRGYMICGGISYVINAQGLGEEELKPLLLSMAEKKG